MSEYVIEFMGQGTKDGQMTDAEMESLIDRLGEKKRPLDEVRDFNPVRQAIKELEAKQ